MIARFSSLAAPLLLIACAEPGADACDTANSDITLGNLLNSSLSGSYDACLDDLRSELATIRLENTELRAKAERLKRERATLSARESALIAEEAALRREIDSLSSSSSPDPASVTRVRERQRELNRQFGLIFG